MKAFFERHKTAILIVGSIIGLYLLYKWYQGYAANQAANQSATDAANAAAALQAQQDALAQQGLAYGGAQPSGATASSPGLVSVGLNNGNATGNPVNPTSTGSNPSSPGATVTTPGTGPGPQTTQVTQPGVTSAEAAAPGGNVISSQATGARGKGLFGGPGATAAQIQTLQQGFANPSSYASGAIGSYNYTLNEIGAESEPGFNQQEFDQYYSSLTNNGVYQEPSSVPAFIAYAGSDPTVVNEELEAQGLPPAFPGLETPSSTQTTSPQSPTISTPAKYGGLPEIVGIVPSKSPNAGIPQSLIGSTGITGGSRLVNTVRPITTIPVNTVRQIGSVSSGTQTGTPKPAPPLRPPTQAPKKPTPIRPSKPGPVGPAKPVRPVVNI